MQTCNPRCYCSRAAAAVAVSAASRSCSQPCDSGEEEKQDNDDGCILGGRAVVIFMDFICIFTHIECHLVYMYVCLFDRPDCVCERCLPTVRATESECDS